MYILAPSLLAADFTKLGEQIKETEVQNSVSGDEAIVLIEYLPDILGLLCLFSTTTPF